MDRNLGIFQQQPLRSTNKCSMTVNEYVLKIKTIGHALSAIGEPVSDDVFVIGC